jgi:endonuclease/exonuclease/phosphatase family metal-dependent hydrolase
MAWQTQGASGSRLFRSAVSGIVAIGSAILLAVAPVTSSGAVGTSPGRDVELRVVSYNIHTGIGSDGRLDLARTAQTLEAVDADVIGLQEVDVHWAARSEWRDQARALATELQMRVFFAPIYDFDPAAPGEPRRKYGLAVLTDLPVVHTENHSITRLSTQGTDPVPEPAPGFPEVVVNVGGALVHVYVTHLDYRADPAVRAMQVDDTLAILDEDRDGAQQVLVGDFNAPPDAPELAPLWSELVDSWDVAGSGSGLTFPATEPTKRIDYVTHSPSIRTRDVAVVQTQASDHLPVVADLVVRRGN